MPDCGVQALKRRRCPPARGGCWQCH